MKLRAFELKEEQSQQQYVDFRTNIETYRPPVFTSIERLPQELFYNILIRSAIAAGWVEKVVEKNEYDEETEWEWTVEYFENLPAGKVPLLEWGEPVLDRWLKYKELDPN